MTRGPDPTWKPRTWTAAEVRWAAGLDRAEGRPVSDAEWSERRLPRLLDQLHEALLEAERWKRAAGALARRIEAAILTDVAAYGAIRLGEEVFTVGRPDRRLIDPAGMAAFLGDEWDRAVRLDAGNVRIVAVRAIAEARGLDPDAVESTFYDRPTKEDRPTLARLPVNNPRTPRYLARLAPGERLPKKPETVTPAG